uniref:Farnesoic acid O-methyl transferase domain-containing protein n=1 Tax=Anopheles farauti TaxID=69004 RepID=A0A182Q4G7_9DIPT
MFPVKYVHCSTHCVQLTYSGNCTRYRNTSFFFESGGMKKRTSRVPARYSGYRSKHSCVASARGLLFGQRYSSNRPIWFAVSSISTSTSWPATYRRDTMPFPYSPPASCGRGSSVSEARMALRVLFGALCLGAQAFQSLHGASGGIDESGALSAVGENCEHHTTTTSQFEEYFDIDRIGNNRSDQNVVDLTLFVQVHNMQEELAILLSASNRSRQHPDYGRTYEVRISNVYTVIYKETLRMSAHHSHNFNFFPGEQFRLRIQITRAGHITVSIPGLQKSLILTVHDERPPIEVSYISFGSRMNAYPVTFYFHCVAAGAAAEPPGELDSHIDTSVEHGSEDHQEEDSLRQHTGDDDRDDLDAEDGGDGRSGGRQSQESAGENQGANQQPTHCPVCPKPEKCEVIVKACSDTSKDLLMQASGTDSEKQKYFFYFNVYLSSKGEKGGPTKLPTTDTVNQIA